MEEIQYVQMESVFNNDSPNELFCSTKIIRLHLSDYHNQSTSNLTINIER